MKKLLLAFIVLELAGSVGAQTMVKIIIPKTSVSSEINNFVFYIDMSSTKLLHVINAARNDGMDIQIYKGENMLPRELVAYVKSPQAGQFYCLLDTVSNLHDDTLYMTAGSGISYANDTNTWRGAGFLGVYHFEDASGDFSSSTGRNNGNLEAGITYAAIGKIGKSISLTPTSYFRLGAIAEMLGATSYTMETWVKLSSTTGGNYASGLALWNGTDKSGVAFMDSLQENYQTVTGTSYATYHGALLPISAWHRVTAVYNGNGADDAHKNLFYFDGTAKPAVSIVGSIPSALSESGTYTMWYNGDGAGAMTGLLDELRINSHALSAAEAAAYYANESSPSTFYNIATLKLDSVSSVLWNNAGGDTIKFYGSGFGATPGHIKWYVYPIGTPSYWSDTLVKLPLAYYNGNGGEWVRDTLTSTLPVTIYNIDSTQGDSSISTKWYTSHGRDFWTGHSFIAAYAESSSVPDFWYYPQYSKSTWQKYGYSGAGMNYINDASINILKSYPYLQPNNKFFLMAGVNDMYRDTSVVGQLKFIGRVCDYASFINHIGVANNHVYVYGQSPWTAPYKTPIFNWNVMVKNICAAHGWNYVDMYDTLEYPKGSGIMNPAISADGQHPNAAGSRIIAYQTSIATVPTASACTHADPAHMSVPCSFWFDKTSYTDTALVNKMTGGYNFHPATTMPDTSSLGIHFDGTKYLLGPTSQNVQGNKEFTCYIKFQATSTSATDTNLLKNEMLAGWRQQGFGLRGTSCGWAVLDTQSNKLSQDTIGVDYTDTFSLRVVGNGVQLSITNLKTGRTKTALRDTTQTVDTSTYQYYLGYGQRGDKKFTGYIKSIAMFPVVLSESDQSSMDRYYSASGAWAASNITIASVTGSFKNGQTVTIAGAGFTAKSPAKPLVWADFATDINPSTLGVRTTWSDNGYMQRTTSAPAGAGTTNAGVGTWNSVVNPTRSFSFGVSLPASPYYKKVYTFGKRYFDFPTTTNQKIWRLNPYTGCEPPSPIDPVISFSSGANNWLAHLNECDADNRDRFTDGHMYTENTWSIEEVKWQFSGGSGKYLNGTTALGSGIIDYVRNGEQLFRQESWNNCDSLLGDLRLFDNFTPDNTPTDTPPTGSHVYMTYLYADTVYNRVIIGDQPTLAASTHREIQVPTAWADGSVTVSVNQGAFSAGETVYLYVYNSQDSASAGFSVTIAGASGGGVGDLFWPGITIVGVGAFAVGFRRRITSIFKR